MKERAKQERKESAIGWLVCLILLFVAVSLLRLQNII